MDKVGKYELHEELGKGGFGTVFRATDPIGRNVAIKILKPGFIDNPEVMERFRQEALSAGSLFHQNIATILDFDESDGRFFIVMRYINGSPLDQIIKSQGKLPWARALKILVEVGEGLKFAHEKKFVHRDIKPGNIIVSPTDGAILTDFGLVKAMMTSGLSSTNAILGTPAYIAPEIWSGQRVSPATDVYSLACVLFEMVTGKALFHGESTPEIMKKHFEEIQLPEKWPSGTPENFPAVITKALSKDPKDRYKNIPSFFSALVQEGSTASISSGNKPAPISQIGSNPKGRLIWVAGGLILAVLAGAGILASIFGNRNQETAAQSPTSSFIADTEVQVEQTMEAMKSSIMAELQTRQAASEPAATEPSKLDPDTIQTSTVTPEPIDTKDIKLVNTYDYLTRGFSLIFDIPPAITGKEILAIVNDQEYSCLIKYRDLPNRLYCDVPKKFGNSIASVSLKLKDSSEPLFENSRLSILPIPGTPTPVCGRFADKPRWGEDAPSSVGPEVCVPYEEPK